MRVIKPAGPPPEKPAADVEHLTAWHACDRCGTRAFEVWRHAQSWDILTFCQHHGREAQAALHDRGFKLYMTARAYA